MTCYIERNGEFFPFFDNCGLIAWEVVKKYPDMQLTDRLSPITKRDFEIGARVYFEGVGWTEVTRDEKERRCYVCALDMKGKCSRTACRSDGRADKFLIIFKKIEEPEEPEMPEEPTESTPDPVSHPTHYTGRVPGIECIQVTQHFNFNRGNAIKYLWRAGEKDKAKEKEDLLKARQYIDFELKRLEEEESIK